jgi:hypothetical protein
LKAACDGLVELKDRSSVDELLALVDQPCTPMHRAVLLGTLARLKSDDLALVERLDKQLDNNRASVRRATIDALVSVGDPRAIQVLLARRAKDQDPARLVRAIDDAVEELRAKEHNIEQLTKEIESLKSQNHTLDELLRKREHECADAPGAKRVRGPATYLHVHRPARFQCARQRGTAGRLDRDHLRIAVIPRRDAADQSATTDCDEHGL